MDKQLLELQIENSILKHENEELKNTIEQLKIDCKPLQDVTLYEIINRQKQEINELKQESKQSTIENIRVKQENIKLRRKNIKLRQAREHIIDVTCKFIKSVKEQFGIEISTLN